MRVFLPLIVVVAALSNTCGNDGKNDHAGEGLPGQQGPSADTPIEVDSQIDCPEGTVLTYENFGKGFVDQYCVTCHSSTREGDYRYGATEDFDFDSYEGVITNRLDILGQFSSRKMPPSNFVVDTDRQLALEWLNCGAPAASY